MPAAYHGSPPRTSFIHRALLPITQAQPRGANDIHRRTHKRVSFSCMTTPLPGLTFHLQTTAIFCAAGYRRPHLPAPAAGAFATSCPRVPLPLPARRYNPSTRLCLPLPRLRCLPSTEHLTSCLFACFALPLLRHGNTNCATLYRTPPATAHAAARIFSPTSSGWFAAGTSTRIYVRAIYATSWTGTVETCTQF